MNMRHEGSLLKDLDESGKRKIHSELRRIAWDTWSGMLYSNVAAYCIILATAVTLHAAGIRDINTAAEAASALRPLAGEFAFLLFALGILGVGLMGVPVLAGSAAYALSEVFGWRSSLEYTAKQAGKFYLIIAFSVLGALAIQYSPISPMKALFWSAVLNGVVAVPLMVAIMILSCRASVMGPHVATRSMKIFGWLATAFMAMAAIYMFVA
jgi:Mn2+/Fe2+ NRAMP family transporter